MKFKINLKILTFFIVLVFLKASVLAGRGGPDEEVGSSSKSVITQPKDHEKKFILSIDGGGIRGIIPARILSRIEEDLQNRYGQPVNLMDLFDVGAGTSTGGIITLGLSVGISASELLDLYVTRGPEIFTKSGIPGLRGYYGTIYDPQPLEKILHEKFGVNTLRETKLRVIVPAHDLNSNYTYFFDSVNSGDPIQNFFLRDVARATSAAPTFFPAAVIKNKPNDEEQRREPRTFVDGGVALNNPTEVVFERSREERTKKYIIISLGTGESLPKNLIHLEQSGAIRWGHPLISLMMSAAGRFIDQRMVQFAERLNSNDGAVDYIRIQPIIDTKADPLDLVSEANIRALRSYADKIFEGNDGVNSDNCKKLIEQLEKRLIDRGFSNDKRLSPKMLFRLAQVQRKSRLSLEGEEVNSDTLVAIQEDLSKRKITQFTSLYLLGSKVTDIPNLVTGILLPFKIEQLVLDGSNEIATTGIKQFCNLLTKHESPLAFLSMQRMGLKDDAGLYLGRLCSENPKLKELRLGNNDFSEAMVRDLREIEEISLEYAEPDSSLQKKN